MLTRLTSSQQVLLQWIAIIGMTLDHIVIIFYDSSHWIHNLSRFVYPLFAYLVTYNYLFRTSNKLKYLKRILLWAVISQPIYSWSLSLSFYKLNILFTLFLGLALIYCHEYLKTQIKTHHEMVVISYVCLFLSFLAIGPFASYYWFGLMILITFTVYFQNKSLISLVFVAINIVLLNIMSGGLIQGLYGLSFFLIVVASIQLKNVAAIPRSSGCIFYAYYPGHFLILGIIHSVL